MKYTKCPAAQNCWDYKNGTCEDCAHAQKYQSLYRKIGKLKKQIGELKEKETTTDEN